MTSRSWIAVEVDKNSAWEMKSTVCKQTSKMTAHSGCSDVGEICWGKKCDVEAVC